MIKESQEEIQELSEPFKVIFQDAIEQTREEILKRNTKTRIAVARNSPSRKNRPDRTKPFNEDIAVTSPTHKPQRPELAAPLNAKQISFSQFTESDKRNVVWKFLSSQEVLFLVYGLMFPSQTIAAANQALNGPDYMHAATKQI